MESGCRDELHGKCSRLKQCISPRHFVLLSQQLREFRAVPPIFRYPEHVIFLAPSPGSQDDVEKNAPQRALVRVRTDPPDWQ